MTTLVVTAGLMSGAISTPAVAQSQNGPGELWDAYPLDERPANPVPTPTTAAPGPVRAPAAMEGNETAAGWSLGVLIAGALVAFAVGLVLPLLRRDRPVAAGVGPPATPSVRTRRFAPSAARDRRASRTSSDSRRE